MSTIPDLQPCPGYPFALLPDGVYPCDEAALRTHFVNRFADKDARRAICDGFFRLRSEAVGYGINATQWVNGSFVEGKPVPGDVDVVTFCDFDFLNSLDAQGQRFLLECLDGKEATKATYQTHTFLVASCVAGHPYHAAFEAARAYWRKWFGKTRDVIDPSGQSTPGPVKGFIQMTLGDVNLAPVVATERGAL